MLWLCITKGDQRNINILMILSLLNHIRTIILGQWDRLTVSWNYKEHVVIQFMPLTPRWNNCRNSKVYADSFLSLFKALLPPMDSKRCLFSLSLSLHVYIFRFKSPTVMDSSVSSFLKTHQVFIFASNTELQFVNFNWPFYLDYLPPPQMLCIKNGMSFSFQNQMYLITCLFLSSSPKPRFRNAWALITNKLQFP